MRDKDSDQKFVIAAAAKQSSDTIETIETHISRVYLTDKFAYKQKKPVNFGFVDYTTLEKRISFAKRELSLNRRACSGIYLDLVELRQKKDKQFTGFKDGRLIDVFVRMRRVDSGRFLNNILKSNQTVSEIKINDIIKKTAKRIYLFHKTARTSKRISKFGGYDVYKANWDDNYAMIAEEKGTDIFYSQSVKPEQAGGSKEINKSVPFFVSAAYSSFLASPLFSEFIRLRSEGGFVRDVHGDLRMEHIAVLDPRRVNGICLMDCVEFDERYRCQDIYLDIAFLLMDFEFNGYFYESVLFFGYYKNCFNYLKSIAPFEKYESFVIPFFKAYRAIVRTKISMLSPGEDAPAKALKYFNLASFYLAIAKKRVVILNCGLSGSGKSSLSRLLSEWFYARIVSTDVIRRNLFGGADKSVKYSADANAKVYETMLEEGLKEFENCGRQGNGGGVIFDATFLKRAHREKIINAFNKKDCIFIFVYSKIYDEKEKEEIILKRLADRFGVGGANADSAAVGLNDYSEADAAVYFNQKKYFEEPSEKETALFTQIDAALELKDRFNVLMKTIIITDGL
ncbi:MAG: AAA family ATPase [Deltaproteobacteria bacterium]|nr:AAA family ATPase [Deltaproteobacteria bacterium]